MNFKKILLAVPVLLVVTSNAMAVPCTSTSTLGNLGPPGISIFGNAFAESGTYTDCYTFTLGGTAELAGFSSQVDPLSFLNIETTLSLFEGDALLASAGDQIGSSFAVGAFSFSGLTAGLYSLVADSVVVRGSFGLPLQVGYTGQLASISAASPPKDPELPPVSVPEPGSLALLLAGLVGIITVRRQRLPGNSSIES